MIARKLYKIFIVKILVIFLANTALVNAENYTNKENFGYNFCKKHQFKFFFIAIYDVRLCLNDKKLLSPELIFKDNFSIILNYKKNLSKQKIVTSSINEIKRYYQISQNQEEEFTKKLNSIFISVKKTDLIEAKFNKNGNLTFYHNKNYLGQITNTDFVIKFMNIWLHKNNKHKKLTRDLFKK
jgi:hypothetical protein